MKPLYKNAIRLALCAFLFASCFNQAFASELISTSEYHAYSQSEHKHIVRETYSSKQLQSALIEHGVSPEKAAERIERLTPSEVQHLAAKIDSLPAAGSELTILLLVIIIILLIR